MKITIHILAVLVMLATTVSVTQAEESVGAFAPASVFTAADLPDAEPGKPVWMTSTTGWGYGIAYYENWVYAVSQAGYILQFECDPITAKMTYKGAIPIAQEHSQDKNPQIHCWIRKTEDNQTKLTIFYGDDLKGLMWYGVDKSTGALTAEGTQLPAKCDHHNATQILSPDQQYFCYGGRYMDSVDWFRFGADGIPVSDGSFKLKNHGLGTQAPCIMTSPDGRHLYYLMFSQSDRVDFSKDITPQIDTYDIDSKTHNITYISTLVLPVPVTVQGRVCGSLEPFSTDGKFTYAIFSTGKSSYYYALVRDSNSGTVTLASPNPDTNAGKLGGLIGPEWDRLNRFAYTDDGLNGYFVNLHYTDADGALERFSRDPTTGALTFLPPIPDIGARKLALDSASGVLITVGEKIASFKVSRGATTKSDK